MKPSNSRFFTIIVSYIIFPKTTLASFIRGHEKIHSENTDHHDTSQRKLQSKFSVIKSGTCESNGLKPIYDREKCIEAADVSGYKITWGPHGGYTDVIDGCSVRHNNQLFFNKDKGTCNPSEHVGWWTYTGCQCTEWMPCLCEERTYFQLRSGLDQSFCLDVPASRTNNGQNIQLYKCHGGNNQLWYFNEDGFIQSKLDGNKCIDPEGPSTANGANVQLWDCQDNYIYHEWNYKETNRQIISRQDPNQCIDVSGAVAENGRPVVMWNCHQGSNQVWVKSRDPSECALTVTRAPEPDVGRTGPGFKILNDTPFPVEVSLNQVGPLYWELIQPGQWMYRQTGAVWFTVKAYSRLDGQSHINEWDAIIPVGIIVASVALAIATAGSSSAISAATAASAGASTATSIAIASTLVGAGVPAGAALYVGTSAVAATTTVLLSTGVVTAVKEVGMEELNGVTEEQLYVSDAGVYAGYPWPFEQKTQVIRITGGIGLTGAVDENGKCAAIMGLKDKLRLECMSGSCFIG